MQFICEQNKASFLNSRNFTIIYLIKLSEGNITESMKNIKTNKAFYKIKTTISVQLTLTKLQYFLQINNCTKIKFDKTSFNNTLKLNFLVQFMKVYHSLKRNKKNLSNRQ